MSSPHDTENDSEDEKYELSTSTLSALQEFYTERSEREKAFSDLQAEAEERLSGSHDPSTTNPTNKNVDKVEESEGRKERKPLTMSMFTEDWNASQFWYNEETANFLAKALCEGAEGKRIAILSAPSAFVACRNYLDALPPGTAKPQLYLLEYDRRFSVFEEFVYYDFQQPLKLPPSLKATIDIFIIDPPFLSTDCQTKAAMTVRWLSSPSTTATTTSSANTPADSTTTTTPTPNHPKIIVCTGERMSSLIQKLYKVQGVKVTDFEPAHAKGLSNEFWCFANFEGGWGWRSEDV